MPSTLKVFAILDRKAGFYNVPFFFPSTGQAIRAAMDMAADPNTILNRHPADFDLFELGEFDDQTARFELYAIPLHLASGVQLMPPVQGPAPQGENPPWAEPIPFRAAREG